MTHIGRGDDNLIRNAPHFTLRDSQRIAWLRLIRTENVGPATFRDLINHCGSADNAIAMLPEFVGRTGRKRFLHTPSEAEAAAELEAIAQHGARLVGLGEKGYPPLLRYADGPPPLVTIKGSETVFEKPCVAIVGARNASMAGITMARKLASDLSAAGFSIVSGLARGIDKAAHQASLKQGTIACMAGGINRPYPAENIALLGQIESDGPGASITEMPYDWEPRAKDFPRRNRIIAGMSAGLVVIEAARRSGSLISARLAGEMNRHVFAVPGSPLDPRSEGTNHLIRNGATLVTKATDIIKDLDRQTSAIAQYAQTNLFEDDTVMVDAPDDSDRTRVLSLLSPTPTSLDDVIAHTGLTAGQVSLIVMESALAGLIERHSGNRISLLTRKGL